MRDESIRQRYRERAESFYQAAQLLALDAFYGAAVGLLAVHAGIALTDAVLVVAEGSRSRDQDHGVAANALERLCAARRLEGHGVKHLRALLANKHRFSYGEENVSADDFESAKMRMEQFFKWAYGTFPDLARLGEAQ